MQFVNVTTSQTFASGDPVNMPAFVATAGNQIIVSVRWNNAVTINGMTDAAGNTYTRIGGAVGTDRLDVWYVENCLGHATNVIAIDFSGSSSIVFTRAVQYSGWGTGTLIGFVTNTGSGTLSGGSQTTTAVGQLAFVAANIANTGTTWSHSVRCDNDDICFINKRADDGTLSVGEGDFNKSGTSFIATAINNATQQTEIVVVLFQATASNQPVLLSQEPVEVVDDASGGDVRESQLVLEVVTTSVATSFDPQVSESITVSESVTTQLVTSGISKSTSDTVSVTESVTAQFAAARLKASVGDAVALSEGVTIALHDVLAFGNRQCFAWRAATAFAASTSYYAPFGNGITNQTSEFRATSLIAAAGRIRNLVVTVPTAPGAAKSATFTLRVNGIDTALTVTISGTGTTSSDMVHAVTVAPGDFVTLKVVGSGSPTTSIPQVALEFVSVVNGESVYGGCSSNTINTTRYTQLFGGTNGGNWLGVSFHAIAACAGVITQLYIKSDAPVTSGNYVFTIFKEGVAQDGSGGTPDTRATLSSGTTTSSSFSLSVSPGDRLQLRAVPTSVSPACRIAFGVNFIATTPGESHMPGGSDANASGTATQYRTAESVFTEAWNATETLRQSKVGVTAFAIRAAYFRLASSVTSGSRALTVRKNAGVTALTATIPAGSASASIVTDVDCASGDLLSVQAVPTGSPAQRPIFWGLRQFTLSGLAVSVSDSITVSDQVTSSPMLNVSVSDSVTVSERVTVTTSPVRRSVADAIAVSESVTAHTIGALSKSVSDSITVADVAIWPIRAQVFDTIAVTELSPVAVNATVIHITVADTITVTEAPIGSSVFNRLDVVVADAISVLDGVARVQAGIPAGKSATDFVRVREFVKAQMYIGGGIFARVADAVTVTESPFHIGHHALPGGPGTADEDQTDIGPEPGVPTDLGGDYWDEGV